MLYPLGDLRVIAVNQIGEVPEWLNGAVSKTVVGLKPTVGSNPTLSAERITFRASSPAATPGERVSKC